MNIVKPTLGSLRILLMAAAAFAYFGATPKFAFAFINGLDVYTGDGTITWSSVKAGGYDFAFVKADEGVNAPDGRVCDEHVWRKRGRHLRRPISLCPC